MSEATSDTSVITAPMATFTGLSTEESALQVLPRLPRLFGLRFGMDLFQVNGA